MRAMTVVGRRRMSLVAVGAVLVLGASACTGDDAEQAADELPLEVEGEVLDRRDPTEEQDDANATDSDVTDEVAGEDQTDDVADDLDGAGDRDGDGTATVERTAPSDGTRSGGTSARGPAPGPTPSPAGSPRARPAPATTGEPTPVATPEPRTVADGPALSTGPILDSDGVDWVVTSSRTVERDEQPPALTVALLPGEDAPRRQVRCQAALEAPSDRGLVAQGTLTVSLRIDRADGTVTTLARQRLELDVTLASGRRLELAASPPRELDVADVRQVTCVAELVT